MFQNIPPITKSIIIINLVVFVCTNWLFHPLLSYVAAYHPLSQSFKAWQIITHIFTHGGYMHILFNMLTLVSFGSVIERVLGPKQYLNFYMISGVGAFFIYSIWNLFLIQNLATSLEKLGINPAEIFSNSNVFAWDQKYFQGLQPEGKNLLKKLTEPMVGASGSLFGIITAFTLLFPNSQLMMIFIPFRIKAKFLLPIIIVVSIFLGIKQIEGDNIAHFAHLGGALVGYIWINIWKKNQMNTNNL